MSKILKWSLFAVVAIALIIKRRSGSLCAVW